MKVTPLKKKFGKYAPGDEFELPDKAAKIFIKVGKLAAVTASQGYQTRMMTAQTMPASVTRVWEDDKKVFDVVEAPYGYKVDGTPRKRPGRAPSVSE